MILYGENNTPSFVPALFDMCTYVLSAPTLYSSKLKSLNLLPPEFNAKLFNNMTFT